MPLPQQMHDTSPYDALLGMLMDLDGVRQSRRYHPEGDALFHTMQVFELATRGTRDRELWAAALLHDVGKAVDGPTHDAAGAAMLGGLVTDRVVWLVAHHLDLMRAPRRTRRQVSGQQLSDLEQLRRWDLGGRDPRARAMRPEEGLEQLFSGPLTWLAADGEDVHGGGW